MWKVTNEENKKYLIAFRKRLINPLMKSILIYKLKENKYNSFSNYLNSHEFVFGNSKELLKIAISITKDGKKIGDYIEEIKKKELSYLINQYNVYQNQTKSLDNLDYNIVFEPVDEIYKTIFSKFFYQSFFTDNRIWCEINSQLSNYNRLEFHHNFKKENDMSICPYCDIDTITSDGNVIIEHYMPKDKYPFLAMHPNNLISACYGCNGPHGKRINYYIPITSPYKKQIGDEIIFNLDKKNKKVVLSSLDNEEVNNFIKMLNLKEKYESESVFNILNNKSKQIFRQCWKYENMCTEKIDEILFEDYLLFKKEPLTFATKCIYRDIVYYEDYKRNLSK
ncbi:hypothetical protein [Clostridium combesii]|uniref:HNH endonuclease n=1 Tax=Clostridium combesii TaxID=39481 RepID=A0A2G7HDC2_9CLOT|nr:hypothetical protein [Clostridium combesii]PIH03105.1 hypothetical protein CS538_14670 [Clostridium combesii]